MDLRDKVLGDVDLDTARVLEVGPLHNPQLRKEEADVRYIDIAGTDELRAKYADNPHVAPLVDRLVDVDYVLRPGQTLAEATGDDAPFDLVIASHVIEHVADPVGWLGQVWQVLAPGGALSLVIPDKRYCFDVNRQLTTMADLVDAHLRRLTAPGFRQIYDHEANYAGDVDQRELWAGRDVSALRRRDVEDPDAFAYAMCQQIARTGEYRDVHSSTFTPESFLSLLDKVTLLGLTDFQLSRFYPTEPDDLQFFVTLVRSANHDDDTMQRRERQRAAIAEVSHQVASQRGVRRVQVIKRRAVARLRSLRARARGVKADRG